MDKKSNFEWDDSKEQANIDKHNISFYEAQEAFLDYDRIILKDVKHSYSEDRYYCIGMVNDEIITVRFTYRQNGKIIRIIGAGYWREGREIYEQKNKIYQ